MDQEQQERQQPAGDDGDEGRPRAARPPGLRGQLDGRHHRRPVGFEHRDEPDTDPPNKHEARHRSSGQPHQRVGQEDEREQLLALTEVVRDVRSHGVEVVREIAAHENQQIGERDQREGQVVAVGEGAAQHRQAGQADRQQEQVLDGEVRQPEAVADRHQRRLNKLRAWWVRVLHLEVQSVAA